MPPPRCADNKTDEFPVIQIDFNRHGFRFHRPGWAMAALLMLFAGPVMARSVGYPPEGLPVGRWVLAPYFISQVGMEDNLFRLSGCPVDEPDCLDSQVVSRNMLGLAARLPVRNSLIELRYQAEKRQYERAAPPLRPLEEVASVLGQFSFSSGDQLVISDTYTRGSSDVRAIDEGGEFEFQDRPYDLNRFEAIWTRTIPSHQGFIVRIARIDLNFAPPEDPDKHPIPFFDYRGFESNFEYRQPLAGRKWIRVYYDLRRFNHYDPNDRTQTGIPFRKEVADTLQLGLGGLAGRNKPFNLRFGYGRFRLEGTDAEFNGIVGAADIAIGIGTRTNLTVAFWRRPLPSNFNTYYIVNSLRMGVERPFLREFMAGVSLVYARSQYGDVLTIGGVVEDEIRKDQRFVLEAYLDWFIHPRVAIRVAAGHQQRLSSSEGNDFEANAVTVGLRLGWF